MMGRSAVPKAWENPTTPQRRQTQYPYKQPALHLTTSLALIIAQKGNAYSRR